MASGSSSQVVWLIFILIMGGASNAKEKKKPVRLATAATITHLYDRRSKVSGKHLVSLA